MRIRAFAACSVLTLARVCAWAQSAAAPPPPPPPPVAVASVPATPADAAPVSTGPATAAFEVADVHDSSYDRNLSIFTNMQGGGLTADRYILRQATMTQLIVAAYNFDPDHVQGGPSWLDWDRYDIEAKTQPTASKETIRLKLQSLLAQRFSLVVHKGSAPVPAYVLRAPTGKAKLKESEGTGDSGCKPQPPSAPPAPGVIPQIIVTCSNETMAQLVAYLHMIGLATVGDTAKPFIDSTGLDGAYDFDIKWTPAQLLARAGSEGISIFDAVDKQLGLKFALETAPQPVLIVDSVNEAPTPNVPDLAKLMSPLPLPEFDVATIKPSKPEELMKFTPHGDQLDWRAITIQSHICFAWDINFNDKESLVGAPKWLNEERFDILAKLPSDDSADGITKAPQVLQPELEQMLRALIEDRFRMKYHWETRPITAYNLATASPKLTPADAKARTKCVDGPGPDGKDPRLTNPILNRLITCQNISMAQFGVLLQSLAPDYFYSSVLDDTGLKGSYNFTLSFTSSFLLTARIPGSASLPDGAQQAAEPNGAISIFDAVRNQLGLKLEKEKRPLPVLVIDHIEEPTAN